MAFVREYGDYLYLDYLTSSNIISVKFVSVAGGLIVSSGMHASAPKQQRDHPLWST
jgi:hypothetical protein